MGTFHKTMGRLPAVSNASSKIGSASSARLSVEMPPSHAPSERSESEMSQPPPASDRASLGAGPALNRRGMSKKFSFTSRQKSRVGRALRANAQRGRASYVPPAPAPSSVSATAVEIDVIDVDMVSTGVESPES